MYNVESMMLSMFLML